MPSFRPTLTSGGGTGGDDFLFGSQGDDVINTGAGADTVYALGGEDTIDGGGNDDTVHGGTGSDDIAGDSGDDTLYGEDDADAITGWTGDDELHGGGEEDYLVGGPGTDRIFGGDDNDQITWFDGDGSDTVDGGSGEDGQTIVGNDRGGTSAFVGEIFELSPNTTERVGTAPNEVSLATEALFQRTTDVPFRLELSHTEVVNVNGGGGADTLTVRDLTGTGVNSVLFDGGDGSERLIASTSLTPITAFGGGGSDFFSGSQGDDNLSGGDRGDRIGGNGGNDTIRGDDGDDTLVGGLGNDLIDGGSGADGIVPGAGDDSIRTGDGLDVLRYDFVTGPPVGIGNDTVLDFNRFVDDFRFFNIAQNLVDTNSDNVVDQNDTVGSVVDGNLVLTFDPEDSITVLGTNHLDIGSNLFFG